MAQPQRDAVVIDLDLEPLDGLIARALELLREPQDRGAAGDQLLVALARERLELAEPRRALAVVAGELADQAGLARGVARQPGR